jgi:ribosome recycling factor
MAAQTGEAVFSKHGQDCKGAVTAFKRELTKVRGSRASAGLVDNLMVEYYGAKTQLAHLAQISTPEARLILIQAHDPNAVAAIEKAIRSSGLGFNPMREGNVLRVSVPALTEETRRDLIKHLHKMAEEVRISVRNHRRDANEEIKKLEKESVLTKDDSKKTLDRIQKQTDQYIAEIDKLLAAKEQEVKEV